MALFRGTVKGGRGQASRLGHGTTGLETVAQSWDGQIRTRLYEERGVVCVEITAEAHGGGETNLLFVGPVAKSRDPRVVATVVP